MPNLVKIDSEKRLKFIFAIPLSKKSSIPIDSLPIRKTIPSAIAPSPISIDKRGISV